MEAVRSALQQSSSVKRSPVNRHRERRLVMDLVGVDELLVGIMCWEMNDSRSSLVLVLVGAKMEGYE